MGTKKIDQLISDAEKHLKKLDNAREKVLAELEELNRIKKARLQIRESAPLFPNAGITKESSADEKISLSSVHYSKDGKIFMQLDGKMSEAADQAISLRAGTSG